MNRRDFLATMPLALAANAFPFSEAIPEFPSAEFVSVRAAGESVSISRCS